MIRKARASDARSIASIYNQYILNSTVTFGGFLKGMIFWWGMLIQQNGKLDLPIDLL